EFDAAGRRVAVLGGDAGAGRYIERVSRSAASVIVFPHPPRRAVTSIRRWRRRTSTVVVTSPIDTVTASGIRTGDGTHHDADAIVYGTGFTLPERDDNLVGTRGITLRQAWCDGMEPYQGVAVHGFPNYFLINGPESARYVVACLQLVKRRATTRIEVRRSSQQLFNERVYLRSPRRRLVASAFELSSGADVEDETYDGPATLTLADTSHQVRVRLSGHIDPIDGQYHWQGMVFDRLPDEVLAETRAVTLTVGEQCASARITEQTPQGTYSVAGVGTPPFTLGEIELAVPQI
ncbi:MAG: DUF4873 domain-containing protein, partial [Mycobacterium sp.]